MKVIYDEKSYAGSWFWTDSGIWFRKDFEFTRRAAQRFRQVVSLDGFEDEDADVIFHYLYKEMELVSFGDHLKRYIYERAGIEEPFGEVPQEVYRDIAVDSSGKRIHQVYESYFN